MIVTAASDRARVLADRLGCGFLNINSLPDKVSYEKISVFPFFIFGGFEYARAAEKIKAVFPNADILPPLIRDRRDYFKIKSLVSQSESDIFVIHKSKAADIADAALWKIGESSERVLEHIKTRGLTKIGLYMLFVDTKFHYENDILPFAEKLKNYGVECEIKLRSVLESGKIIEYIIKRTREYEIDRKTAQTAQNAADKGNGA